MGLSLVPRQRQGFVAPGPPLHRIVGVLEQVGAGGTGKAIGPAVGKRGRVGHDWDLGAELRCGSV